MHHNAMLSGEKKTVQLFPEKEKFLCNLLVPFEGDSPDIIYMFRDWNQSKIPVPSEKFPELN